MIKKTDFKLLVELFTTFFKIGGFTFGGGYAMIPLIEREVVDNKGWVNKEDIIDVFAVAQSVPGAIAINSSTFIGYKIGGKKGAVAATLGVVLPSFIIITLIAAFFSRFQKNPVVKAAFMGIRSAVVALIAMAAVKIGKASIRDNIGILITTLSVILVLLLDLHAIFTIVGGGLAGLAIYKLRPDKVKKSGNRGGKKA